MTIIAQIKEKYLDARKARNKEDSATLSTLVGECEAVGKIAQREPTDAECVAKLKSAIKNAQVTLEAAQSATNQDAATARATTSCINEIALYTSFLPTQLTEAEIHKIFDDIESVCTMAEMMKHLKESYAGRYDGKLAAKVCKERLNK